MIILLALVIPYFVIKLKQNYVQPIVIYIFFYYIIGHLVRFVVLLFQPQLLGNFSLRYILWNSTLASITLLASIISLFFIITGYELVIKSKTKPDRMINFKFEIPWIIPLLFILIGVPVYALINRISAVQSINVNSLVTLLGTFLILMIFYLGEFSIVKRKHVLILISLLSVIIIVIIGFFNAWKGSIVLLFEFILLYIYISSKKQFRKIFILSLVFISITILGVIPIISTYRTNLILHKSTSLEVLVADSYSMSIGNLISNEMIYLSNRFAYFDEEYVAMSMNRSEIDYYRSQVPNPVFSMFSFLFPRFLWPEKPIISTGRQNAIIVAKIPSYVYTNTAISFVGELYLRTGWLGIIFWSFIYGIMMGAVYKLYILGRIQTFMFFWLTFSLNFSEGSMFTGTAGLLEDLIIIYIIFLISRIVFRHKHKQFYIGRL